MYQKIKHFLYYIFIAKKGSLLETPDDPRDFNTGIFNWFGYKPKNKKHIIKTLSIFDQKFLNICQWCATTTQKEVDEKKRLSKRLMVCKGRDLGYISGNGFSNLRSGQKTMQNWGMVEFKTVDETINNWKDYTNLNSSLYDNRASKHKIASYWAVSSRNDILKLLDKDKVLTTGMRWYTSFNQGGGFKYPWVINKTIEKKGYSIGSHAFAVIGYDLDYNGKEVYICQNSYGSAWGDSGKFYIEMSYLDNAHHGFYTNLDEIHKGLGEFMTVYDGKNVKGKGDNGIFHIQSGKKKPYPNWLAYLSFNGFRRGYTEVDKTLLDEIPEGDIMDIAKSGYWKFLEEVKKDKQLDKLLEILNKEN